MKQKSTLRTEMKQRLSALSAERRRAESQWLCEHLAEDPRIQTCRNLGIFLSLPDEPDLRPLYRTLTCLLALPVRMEDETPHSALPTPHSPPWCFRQVLDQEEGPPDSWGLRFPALGPIIPASELEMILVPGRAFTPSGLRLGRGAGIYDRLLADSRAWRTGVAFRCQIRDDLPGEPHDVLMNEVLAPPM